MHRRHDKSITLSKENNERHFNEIVKIQEDIISQLNIDNSVMQVLKKYQNIIRVKLLKYAK